MREKKLNPSFDWLPAGSVFAEGDKINKMTAPYESSLFSSSFSDIFSRKCKFFYPFLMLIRSLGIIFLISSGNYFSL